MKRLSPLERSKLPMNDLGNARRMFEACRSGSAAPDGSATAGDVKLLWLADGQGGKGCWVAFDGVRWSIDQGPARALAFAQKVAADLLDEVAALRDATPEELSGVFGPKFTPEMAQERCGHLFGWSVKSGDMAKAGGMMGAFKGLRDGEDGPFVTQAVTADFDAQALAYHCANGTLRFVAESLSDPAKEPDRASGANVRASPSMPTAGGMNDGAGDGAGRAKWGHVFEPGHRASDMFMQVSEFVYDSAAVAKHWIERMAVMHHDPVQRDAFQRIYGMTLTALISDQAFYIFHGKGQDGKSVTNDVMVRLHGAYARRADPKTFLEGPSQASASHQSDIVRLSGDIRLVVADEPKKGSTWDGQRIKQATGSEMIARGAHATTEMSFMPHWQLIFECNHLPKPPSDDRGFKRRFKQYPWVVQFGVTEGVPDEAIDVVKARLIAENSGILNWMIAGCEAWLTDRIIPKPAASVAATSSFWDVSSPLGEFLDEKCDLRDPEARIGATELYEEFKRYRQSRGDKDDRIMTQTGFGRALNDMQIIAVPNHITGKKDRVGIKLKDGSGVPDAGDQWLGEAGDVDPFAPEF